MSQLSLFLDSSLLVRDDYGRCLSATADQAFEVTRKVIDQKVSCGTLFPSPALFEEALLLVDVRTLDHIVVGGEVTASFAECERAYWIGYNKVTKYT